MADGVLGDPRMLEGADPTMAALWRWHSAEENEHKAVAFDVYVASGGNYAERVVVMVLATIIFWAKVVEHQVRLMAVDGSLFSLREWLSLAKFMFVEPGFLTSLVPSYLAYYKPGFHPWQHDNRELLEEWKASLENAPAPQPAA
jgi:predicted metal-dependent hydrolase